MYPSVVVDILGGSENLVDGGFATRDLGHAIISHVSEIIWKSGFQITHRSIFGDRRPQRRIHSDQLEESQAAEVAPVSAFLAAMRHGHSPGELVTFEFCEPVLQVFRKWRPLRAVRAQSAAQSLSEDPLEDTCSKVRFRSHVDHAPDRAQCVVGMKRAEHKVSGQCGSDHDVDRLGITGLADEDDIRVLTKHRAQAGGEGQPSLGIHRDLVDASQFVFHGILDRDDLLSRIVELAEACIE